MESLLADVDRRARLENGRNLVIAAFVAAALYLSGTQAELDPARLVAKAPQMLRFLNGFVHPNFDVVRLGNSFPEGLVEHFAIETITIAVLGTFIGSAIAVPISFMAARNLMRRNLLGTVLYFLTRTVMSIVRAVPTLFWGLIFVSVVSVGPFAGVLAVTIFSFGLMSKLFSEAIEAIDWGQVEALTATGANPVQVVVHAVLPQVTPYLVANLLYTFEVNIHSATILGLIGAGGLGFLFQQYAETQDYDSQAMLLYVVIVMTTLIDNTSAAIRRRII